MGGDKANLESEAKRPAGKGYTVVRISLPTGAQGREKIAWVPIRRHITWASP